MRRPIATDTEVVVITYQEPERAPVVLVADSPGAADALIADHMLSVLSERGSDDAKADIEPLLKDMDHELYDTWYHHFNADYHVEHCTVHRVSTAIDNMAEAVEDD